MKAQFVWAAMALAASNLAMAAPAKGPLMTVSYTATLVEQPAGARNAVKLPGKIDNPVDEEWETRVPTATPTPGSATQTEPELWVRNVSQPTLEPFLPNPSRASGAAVIIAPGGAFLELSMEREGYSVAKWLNERGIAAFVLKYPVAPSPEDPQAAALSLLKWARERVVPSIGTSIDPMTDEQHLARNAAVQSGLDAIRYVRGHAAEWHLSSNRIGIMGFSAGAATALGVALKAEGTSRPDLVAPIYGALPADSRVPSTAPPAFIAVAADDMLSPLSLAVYTAWRTSKVPAELHVLESGGHGFGMLHQGTGSDNWLEPFDRWLAFHGFEKSAPAFVAESDRGKSR